ncbi:MAG TPA: hypothetical protein VMN81_13005 [Vicinamibacterales bacterium]|nr:hypothetical protein [Vicinamibacterales bacterium]
MRVPIWLRITAALWAAVFLFIALTLPPSAREAQGFSGGHVRRGAFHVHSVASDGGGTREEIARAASRAGLDFVILTDHGDGTRPPAAPEYLRRVLVIDGVEVTTSGGHYAAFGAARAPYPLGGPPYAVIEDVARLGGFGAAAHPDSAKAELRWRDWTARVDGVEWINGDSAWRDEGALTLARGLIDYLFRPAPVLAGLVERPGRLLQRIDDMSRARRVVALAGADAHARLPLTTDDEPYEASWTVPAPSYVQSFRAFANLVETGEPMTGNAEQDAAALMRAIRDGRVAFAMTSLAQPAQLSFLATAWSGDVGLAHAMGARIPPGQPVTFSVRTSDVLKSGMSLVRLALLRDGRIVKAAEGPQLSHHVEDARGVWRVEATLAHRPDVPWLLGNPIVVGDDETAAPEPDPAPAASLDIAGGAWAVEKQEHSDGTVEAAGGGQRFSYQLAGGALASQFAAAVRPTGSTDAWDTVVLTARADTPTRLWVQLRLSDSRTGQRWGRSIYVDETSRTYRLPLRDFGPLEPRASASRPNVVQVHAVLIVVDTVNTAPGAAGQIAVDSLQLQRQP